MGKAGKRKAMGWKDGGKEHVKVAYERCFACGRWMKDATEVSVKEWCVKGLRVCVFVCVFCAHAFSCIKGPCQPTPNCHGGSRRKHFGPRRKWKESIFCKWKWRNARSACLIGLLRWEVASAQLSMWFEAQAQLCSRAIEACPYVQARPLWCFPESSLSASMLVQGRASHLWLAIEQGWSFAEFVDVFARPPYSARPHHGQGVTSQPPPYIHETHMWWSHLGKQGYSIPHRSAVCWCICKL